MNSPDNTQSIPNNSIPPPLYLEPAPGTAARREAVTANRDAGEWLCVVIRPMRVLDRDDDRNLTNVNEVAANVH